MRAALQDYHCPDFLVSIPQCPMEIFMPGCSGEIINFPDFLDNNFQYLDVRQSGTEYVQQKHHQMEKSSVQVFCVVCRCLCIVSYFTSSIAKPCS